jgi:4-amino-4-deoxy-L-arabinose transferase-like glycosyltransferase
MSGPPIVPSLHRGQRHLALGLALALFTLLIIVATLSDPGITWDEPLYIKASRGYMSWMGLLKKGLMQGDVGEALSDGAIVRSWMPHPTLELHPPLGKILSGFTWALLRGSVEELSAFRFANATLFSFLVALVFWMISSAYDTVSGLFAALSLVLMPRMFLHAHLANIDTTVAITWFVAMYLFWRFESRRGWVPVVVIGLAYGAALGTKMNAAVMPLVWGAWVLLFRRNWRSVFRLVAMGLIGAATFVAMWPWLWHDTVNRLLYYVLMASRFKDRPQYYLGQILPHVPWHYPFVITLAVVPLVIIVMCFLGIRRVLASRCLPSGTLRSPSGAPADETGWLLILNALTPLLFAATGLQASYSGERHFIPAYPYVACLAGVGFASALNIMHTAWQRAYPAGPSGRARLVLILLLGMLLIPPLLAIVQIHPYELSYYSELVGGMRGAARLGLETTFWCEAYKDALPYLNQTAASGATIWVENPFVLRLYQGYGMLRNDLLVTGGDVVSPLAADYAVIQMRQTSFQYTPEVVGILRDEMPVFSLLERGIALMHVFKLQPERKG